MDKQGQILKIELPDKISTNRIYSGVHFSMRKRHKDLFGWPVRMAIQKAKISKITDQLVDLNFDFHFKAKPLDSSNTSYMAKIIEDWLVKLEVLPGDATRNVRKVILKSSKGKADVCFVEIREINSDAQ